MVLSSSIFKQHCAMPCCDLAVSKVEVFTECASVFNKEQLDRALYDRWLRIKSRRLMTVAC